MILAQVEVVAVCRRCFNVFHEWCLRLHFPHCRGPCQGTSVETGEVCELAKDESAIGHVRRVLDFQPSDLGDPQIDEMD